MLLVIKANLLLEEILKDKKINTIVKPIRSLI